MDQEERQAPKRIAIIANPVAGGGRPYRKLARYLKSWPHPDCKPLLLTTRCAGHAGELAHELLEDPPDMLVVCGGDGTLNEVASRVPAPPFPVAIIPAGTANVLARDLGLPLEPRVALDTAMRAPVRRIDLGTALGRTEHRFVLMAGVGFDAYVVWKVRPRLKRLTGKFAFFISALQSLAGYGFPEFEVQVGSEVLKATSCIVANCRGYGGGLVLTPQADMTDGLLDLVAVQGNDRAMYTRLLYSAWRGTPKEMPGIVRRRAASVSIRGPRGPWAHVDGELIGTLPLEFAVAHKAFPIVYSCSPTQGP
jgi:diacylglycerol kinase (ATP)